MTGPCPCAECVRAGCDRPPVTLGKSKLFPQRELHGRELVKFYAEQDDRKAMLKRLGEQLMAKARESK